MKRRTIAMIALAAAAAAAMAGEGGGNPAREPGLVAHYFQDPDHWNGAWPDSMSQPRPGTDPAQWTFRDYRYSRVEPVVNHLFINQGWFSVRWVGYFDPSADNSDDPSGCTVEGAININPNNSTDNEFAVVTPKSGTITRGDLTKNYPGYSGPAVSVHIKPKGNGNQNTLLVNGFPYTIVNAETYDIASTSMTVRIYNDDVSLRGRARGHWWISITARDALILSSADGLSGMKAGTGLVSRQEEGQNECFFEIHADDGCRLILDGQTVIGDWRPCWEGTPEAVRRSRTVRLSDGPHRIVVEYFQGQSLQTDDRDPMKLYWSCPARRIVRQVIPPSRLSHTEEDLRSADAK